jgi:hypothetical protein
MVLQRLASVGQHTGQGTEAQGKRLFMPLRVALTVSAVLKKGGRRVFQAGSLLPGSLFV